jgi:hypothetical protein
MDLMEIGWERDWIYLAEVRGKWQALGNMIMNLLFHKRCGIS